MTRKHQTKFIPNEASEDAKTLNDLADEKFKL